MFEWMLWMLDFKWYITPDSIVVADGSMQSVNEEHMEKMIVAKSDSDNLRGRQTKC